MVFGNLNDNSGTGVAFTRNPSDGKKELFGEYLLNAQGEDVVAGIRTPKPISKNKSSEESLQETFPDLYNESFNIAELGHIEISKRITNKISFVTLNTLIFSKDLTLRQKWNVRCLLFVYIHTIFFFHGQFINPFKRWKMKEVMDGFFWL